MRLKIRHETTYRYREPPHSAIQLLRLTPRSFDTQFVRRWRVTVDADARLDRGEDAFGNITHLAFIDGPLTALRILVEGEVDTSPGDGSVHGSVERQSARLFLRETALTALSPEIQKFARTAMSAEGGNVLAGLHRINTTLQASMTFEVGTTTSTTTAADAYLRKTGVCQDFAHIMIAAARTLNLPARYVSGYYLLTDVIEQVAGHAWAEIYVAPMGWIAFDPANGVCATERHVRVAVGSDSNEAAPIRGARSGGDGEALAVSISVSEGRVVIDGPTPPHSQAQSQSQSQSQ